MNVNFLYKKIKSIKKRLPGNSLEKMALVCILKAQLAISVVIIISFILSVFVYKYFIILFAILYPAFITGTSFIPAVLQEPGQVNRLQALSYIKSTYIAYFIGYVIASLVIVKLYSFEYVIYTSIVCFIYSIYNAVIKVQKRLKS